MLEKDPKPVQDDTSKDLEIPGIEAQSEDNPDLGLAIPESQAEITSPVEPKTISTPAQQKLILLPQRWVLPIRGMKPH
jgi:hypothetical protein